MCEMHEVIGHMGDVFGMMTQARTGAVKLPARDVPLRRYTGADVIGLGFGDEGISARGTT